MSQPQRQFNVAGAGSNDSTYTKIFVGGLAWETKKDTMRSYFEQFGEIQEAVVITDKNTGRSKGYGFVTFKDPEAASRACENPYPVIDGRRANCNLASLGAQKIRPPAALPQGPGRFRGATGLMAAGSSSAYFQQGAPPYTLPFSAYGYSTGYSQDSLYPMSYYNTYGGQPFMSPYYTNQASGSSGIMYNMYPFYAHQLSQNSQSSGLGAQYPHLIQYPYSPRQYHFPGILSSSLPSMPQLASSTSTGVAGSTLGVAGSSEAASEQNSST